RTLEFHGGAVMHEPLMQVVFLGARWPQPELAGLKRNLQSHLERLAMPEGIHPAAAVGARDIDAPGTMNDLAIQAALDRAINDGALPLRDERVVVVVFLAPDVHSTLG